MGHYLFNFSKKGAAKGRTLREQASELLQAGMWGIGAKAPNRLSLAPGDRVLIYVGAPEYEFIGHAELGSTTHEWTPQEAARYPGSFEGGVLFFRPPDLPDLQVRAIPVQPGVLPAAGGAAVRLVLEEDARADKDIVVIANNGRVHGAVHERPAAVIGAGEGDAVVPPHADFHAPCWDEQSHHREAHARA